MDRSWYSVYVKNGKVGNRGTPTIFVNYAKNHAKDCFHMYNPINSYMTKTRDIMWLHCMYYSKPEAREKVIEYPHVALPIEPEDAKAREGLTLNASEPKVEYKDDQNEGSTVHMRLGGAVKPPVLYMKEFVTNDIEGALSSIHQNY